MLASEQVSEESFDLLVKLASNNGQQESKPARGGMGRKRGRRVEALRMGCNEGERKVWVPGETDGLEKVLERRVEEGYRRGYKRRSEGKNGVDSQVGARSKNKLEKSKKKKRGVGREVELRYTKLGRPVRQERKRRSKPSRALERSKHDVWGLGEESGRLRRQTTKGRKQREEAREKEVGGRGRRRVR